MKRIYQLLTLLISLILFTGPSEIAAQERGEKRDVQKYEEYIKMASEAYDNGDYNKSFKEYTEALNHYEGTSSDYYNAACSAALSGRKEKAIEYLMTSAEMNWVSLDWMKRDSDLTSLHDHKMWSEIVKKVEENVAIVEKDFDHELKKQLEDIYVRDQTLRQLYREAEDKFGEESDEMSYFWDLVSTEDKNNEEKVIKILDERGWPGKSLVGGKANMTVWLVIQHAPLDIQEKYLPMLQNSVQLGESSGSHLALLEDRILMRNDKPQVYGSQIITDPDTGKDKLYDLADPEYVNQRRADVGLGSLEDYVERWGIVFDVKQKYKEPEGDENEQPAKD